jgi:hypothetical protein
MPVATNLRLVTEEAQLAAGTALLLVVDNKIANAVPAENTRPSVMVPVVYIAPNWLDGAGVIITQRSQLNLKVGDRVLFIAGTASNVAGFGLDYDIRVGILGA